MIKFSIADVGIDDPIHEQEKSTPSPSPSVPRIARQLALAHYIDRLVENGGIKDYAEVARRLGITRARMAQVTNLLNLSPQFQESILSGKLRISERRLRSTLRHMDWQAQTADIREA